MNRNEIIAELYNSREFNETIGKMHPAGLRDDLRSEVILILCEKDEQEIISIYQSGGLKYYTVRIILNLIQSSTSPFYKKFRIQSLDLSVLRDQTSYDIASELSDSTVVDNKELSKFSLRYSIGGVYHDETSDRQHLEGLALDAIDTLYWYDKEIIKLYLKLGTYRAVEDETGIPWESVYKTVQKACQKIKLKVA